MLRSASQAKLDQLEESLRMLKQIPRSEARSAEGARLANEIAALEAQVPRLINAKLFEAQAWRIVGGPEALKKSDTALRLALAHNPFDSKAHFLAAKRICERYKRLHGKHAVCPTQADHHWLAALSLEPNRDEPPLSLCELGAERVSVAQQLTEEEVDTRMTVNASTALHCLHGADLLDAALLDAGVTPSAGITADDDLKSDEISPIQTETSQDQATATRMRSLALRSVPTLRGRSMGRNALWCAPLGEYITRSGETDGTLQGDQIVVEPGAQLASTPDGTTHIELDATHPANQNANAVPTGPKGKARSRSRGEGSGFSKARRKEMEAQKAAAQAATRAAGAKAAEQVPKGKARSRSRGEGSGFSKARRKEMEAQKAAAQAATRAAGAKAAEQVLNAHGVTETTKDEM